MEYELPKDTQDARGISEQDCTTLAPLKFDPEDYREIWADYEMSEEQYNAMLGALWEMAKTIMLLGWNADISQIMFSSVIGNSGPDSEKLLKVECSKETKNCANNDAEKESGDENI